MMAINTQLMVKYPISAGPCFQPQRQAGCRVEPCGCQVDYGFAVELDPETGSGLCTVLEQLGMDVECISESNV